MFSQITIALKNAIKWLYSKRMYFNPLDPQFDEKQAHKMFSELQFILSELSKTIMLWDIKTQKYIRELQLFSRNIICNPEYYELLQKYPSRFRMYGMASLYFLSYWKSEDTDFIQNVIRKTYSIAYSISPETPPFRMMEIIYCICGNNYYLNDKEYEYSMLDRYAEFSILNTSYDVSNYTIFDEYAITHSIFYLTNMGERSIDFDKFHNLEDCLYALAYKNLLVDDLDLLGEYVIDICCCKLNNSLLLQGLLNYILNNQRQDGIFPAPLRGRTSDEVIIDNSQYVIRHYHTTLVCILALSIYVRQFQ